MNCQFVFNCGGPLTLCPAVLDKPGDILQCCLMNKRPTPRSMPKKGKDPYLVALGTIWPTIRSAYEDFKDLKPIIQYGRRLGRCHDAFPVGPDLDRES